MEHPFDNASDEEPVGADYLSEKADTIIKIATMRENWETQQEYLLLMREWYNFYADQYYAAYEALKRAGFSADEAMSLIHCRGWNITDIG